MGGFLQLSLRWNSKEPEFYHKSKLVGVENMPYKSFFKPLLESFARPGRYGISQDSKTIEVF